MNIRDVLDMYKKGEIDSAKAERLLRLDFIEKVGEHTVFDHSREARKGIPEIIFGETKTPQQVAEIVEKVLEDKEAVLVSRASEQHFRTVVKRIGKKGVRYHKLSKMITVDRRVRRSKVGRIGILAAGTSDVAVADEARIVAETMGCEVLTSYDIGVAAFHRFLTPLEDMLKADVDVLIVVAGMEGALPSVIGGLVNKPIIAVPTSIGYGANFGGLSALLAMLN
ncbi:MAG: nickel pincer cofactor biosynthesis protein LarB, partial [Methanomassiliicoccales archaeon]|nr:nickel pincer cofactor biosynthesis protein LarB [Methanomassiliicoccales archaeon]